MIFLTHKPILNYVLTFESNVFNHIVKTIKDITKYNEQCCFNIFVCVRKCMDISYIKTQFLHEFKRVCFTYFHFDDDFDENSINSSFFLSTYVFINISNTSSVDKQLLSNLSNFQNLIQTRKLYYKNVVSFDDKLSKLDKYTLSATYNFNPNTVIIFEESNGINCMKNMNNFYLNFLNNYTSYLTLNPEQSCFVGVYDYETYFISINGAYLGLPNKNRELYLYPDCGIYTLFKKITSHVFIYNDFLFDKNVFEIVVSRYAEDLKWVLPYNDIITIYNKNADVFPDSVQLPNVGRESHTYLYHIINNYENLSENTLFTQGTMDDHVPLSMNEYMLNTSITLNLQHKGTIYAKKDDHYGYLKHVGKWLTEYKVGDMLKEKMSFRQWWFFYLKKPIPKIKFFQFSHGAIFAVSKNTIYKNKKEYYNHLIKSVDYHKNPESGHYFERAWYYIF
jgi:hypothetical protein